MLMAISIAMIVIEISSIGNLQIEKNFDIIFIENEKGSILLWRKVRRLRKP